jgi:hypothetical protein
VRGVLRILPNSPLAVAVLRTFPPGETGFLNRAGQLFEFLLPTLKSAGNLDTEKIAIFVSSFSFVKASLIGNFTAVRDFTEHLTDIARETVLAILDSNLDQYASQNLAMVTVVLEKCNECRPILDQLPNFRDYSISTVDELWRRGIQFHRGPVIDPVGFVEAFESLPLSKATRKAGFDVIEGLPWTEGTFASAMRTNHGSLGRKAALWLRLGFGHDTFGLMTLCRNSYKVLDVLFDHMIANQPEEFLGSAAADFLSYQDTHNVFLVTRSKKRQDGPPQRRIGLMGTDCLRVGARKLLAAPYIRYARAVIPRLGKETVFGFLRGHALALERSIRFLTDVLGDVKENGLDATDFEAIFEGMKIIADLKPPFDRELLERFGELLRNPDISGEYDSPGERN